MGAAVRTEATRARGGARRPAVAALAAGAIVAVLAAVLLAGPPAADAGKRKKERVVACFKSTVPQGQKPKFSDRPRRCVFIAAGAVGFPVPPSFAVQQIIKIRWKQWGKKRAKGRGKGYTSARKQPVPVTVTLTRPRARCGHHAFTRAKFNYQYGIPAQPLNLSTC
ncbi:MAG: hypothetical protein KJ006_02590 [Thermoleophilia bacterium]|nr:hypothetical protein [Thermoleophilia bacterium]